VRIADIAAVVQKLARFRRFRARAGGQKLLGQPGRSLRRLRQREALAGQRGEGRLAHMLGQLRFQVELVRALGQ
jgi:hypothetical protein